MSTTVISIEESNLITLEEAKRQLRILHSREDAYISSLIPVVTQMVEESIDRTIVGKQLRFSSLRNEPYFLGNYKIDSVDSVKLYLEGGLVATTEDFLLNGQVLSPTGSTEYDSIEVEFTILTDYPVIPVSFKHAALILLADLFKNRQETILGKSYSSTNAVMRLLGPYTKHISI